MKSKRLVETQRQQRAVRGLERGECLGGLARLLRSGAELNRARLGRRDVSGSRLEIDGVCVRTPLATSHEVDCLVNRRPLELRPEAVEITDAVAILKEAEKHGLQDVFGTCAVVRDAVRDPIESRLPLANEARERGQAPVTKRPQQLV